MSTKPPTHSERSLLRRTEFPTFCITATGTTPHNATVYWLFPSCQIRFFCGVVSHGVEVNNNIKKGPPSGPTTRGLFRFPEQVVLRGGVDQHRHFAAVLR